MKTFKALSLVILATVLVQGQAQAQGSSTKKAKINASEDIDSLGGNKELMEMAERLHPESRSRIVQDRIIDRRNRVEFGLGFGAIFGGDAYLDTRAFSAALDYHITPRWSVGLRYLDFTNNLNAEGDRVFNEAAKTYAAGGRAQAVDIDYPLNATMAVVNWYPIYGKTSFLDIGVTQFDIYLLGGGGLINLDSGSTGIYTAGLGVGAWLSKHVTARAEVKWQRYNDELITGARTIDATMASLGLGWIL
jgi:outer membrane beta-barrel protein